MNIIVGATGQIGSNVISEVKRSGFSVRAVVRNPEKLLDKNVEIKKADLFNREQLIEAFKGGTTVFVLTPENPSSTAILGETKQIVENYREAIQETGVKKVVALSSIGAHLTSNTGNILMSRILEQGLDNLEAEKIFIRPSYYFSNWLGFLDSVEEFNILPTFFPEHLKIDMNSPVDLAKFISKIMTDTTSSENKRIYELNGPEKYSSLDIAETFSKLFQKKVTTQSIPKDKWRETLVSVGFTENTAANLSYMTQAVIDNKTVPERPKDVITLSTTFFDYMKSQLNK